MDSADPQVLPAPPNIIKSLLAGFDAVANHAGILLIPIGLDLLLWLGPRVRITGLVRAAYGQVADAMKAGGAQTEALAAFNTEVIDFLAERFNLLAGLRAYPVGIPSLMAGRAPLDAPGGVPAMLEISSSGPALALWLVFSLVGLGLGTLYFALIARAAINGTVDWRRVLSGWPRAAGQVFLLTLFALLVVLALMVPMSCLLSMVMLLGTGMSGMAFFLLGGALIWVSLPLLFSPHGIFVHNSPMLASVWSSAHLVRMTLPATGMLLLILFVISEGMDALWSTPAETSWLTIVAIAGHAFVTTGLLAASFVYYRDAGQWLQKMLAARMLKKA